MGERGAGDEPVNEKELQRLHRLLEVVEWPCSYCETLNETSLLLWNTVKVVLICRECANVQNYPQHIVKFDPEPAEPFRPGGSHAPEPVTEGSDG